MAFLALFTSHSWIGNPALDLLFTSIGYLLLCLGLGFRLWSLLYIGSRKSKSLVTTGPYSLCRNPLYLGTFAIYLGAGLCLENIVFIIGAVLLTIPLYLWVVFSEERRLTDAFGQAYLNYKRQSHRFWPCLRNFQTPETIDVSTQTIYRTLAETALVIWIPVIGRLIELLQIWGILPVLWSFP